MTKLLLVAGARPNFMKIAPLIREIKRRADRFTYSLVHTGQHYDKDMSDVFFAGLGIPAPDYHLNVGSGTHAQQTAAIMMAFEDVLRTDRPDCVVVFGDVNSTLACSIVAKKEGVAVAHVEAGLRSGDLTMPEEINRIVTDSITDFFFVTEESGIEHLRREGHAPSHVFHVGHVMIDNLMHEIEQLTETPANTGDFEHVRRGGEPYGVVTLHRPSNVDNEVVFRGLVAALSEISELAPLIFPVHPRTRHCIERFGISFPETVITSDPLGYREFLELWRGASIVLTDSGGLQEETTALGIPCLTLRNNTERPATVTEGSNTLVGTDPAMIVKAAHRVLRSDLESKSASLRRPKYWDGKASIRILDHLENLLRSPLPSSA